MFPGQFHIVDIVHELERDNLLPAIVFRTSRSQCDEDVQRVGANRSLLLSAPVQRELRELVHEIIGTYEMDVPLVTSHPQYNTLISSGIGAHHAGQLLMWRLLLEELMANGALRVLVATGTVAAGVDFPARTVVITAHSRRGANGFESLTASEFQQMSGRAGRRGRDAVGFCLAAPAPFCDARTLLKISKQPPEPLVSAYFPSPSTVLNLLRYRNVDDLRFTVKRSLASFSDRRDAKTLIEEAEVLEKTYPHLVKDLVKPANFSGATQKDENFDNEDGQETPDNRGQNVTFSREEKRIRKKIRRLYQKSVELENRQIILLESVLEGLGTLGYLDGLNLSEKGYWAAHLCTNLVLEIGELVESGMLGNVSAERLAAIIGSLSGDEHRTYLESKISPLSREDEQGLTAVLKRVEDVHIPGVIEKHKVLPAAANTVVTWMHTDTWQHFRSILLLSKIAEGDAARLITQTAEQLNQITRLTETHPELALRAEEAKRYILRPPLTEAINLDL